MRNLKPFLMSGIMLCVLYLVVQNTFFLNDVMHEGAETINSMAQKLYSPFTIANQADAEEDQIEESAPVEEYQEEPAPVEQEYVAEPVPVEQHEESLPAEQPKPEEHKEEAPAAQEPGKEEEKKDETKPAEVEQPPVDEGQEEFVGFETIDLAEPSGNWLAKRIWWERAQNRYEQIKGEFDKILESRMPFFKRRAEIDRKILEPLYVSVGLEREEITKILAEFTTLLNVDQEKNAVLDEREKKMQLAAMEDKKTLDQLQEDITKLGKYEDALDSFLDKLSEQVNTGRTYEKQAWQAYKDIGKELNDKKARELYLGMDTPFKRLTDISQYINGIFKQEFDKVDATVQEHATRIKNNLQSLREKGLDFKKYSKSINEKIEQEKIEQETAQEEEQEGGIMATITSWWNMVVNAFSSIYESIVGLFVSSSDDAEQATEPEKQ